MNKNPTYDDIEIPNLKRELTNQELIEKYTNPEDFDNSLLFAKCFENLIRIGQNKNIKRELTEPEIQKMQEAYIDYCNKHGYTDKDFMREIYALQLSHKEKRTGLPLSSLDKFKLKCHLAGKYEYSNSLFKSAKIKDTRSPLKSGHKKTLSLVDFFSDELADIEMPAGEIGKVIDMKSRQKIDSMKRNQAKESLKLKYLKNTIYKAPMKDSTKKRIFSLAAIGVAGIMAFHAGSAIKNSIDYKASTFEAAQEAHYSLDDMGLSSSQSPEAAAISQIELWDFENTDLEIKNLIIEKGSQGLYEDIMQKLDTYSNKIPSYEEQRALLKEIDGLPNAILQDKLVNAYNEAHKFDENFKPATFAVIGYDKSTESNSSGIGSKNSISILDKEENELACFDNFSSKFSTSHRLEEIFTVEKNLEDFKSSVYADNRAVEDGEKTQYEGSNLTKKNIEKMKEYVADIMDLVASKDFKFVKGINPFGSKEKLQVNGLDLGDEVKPVDQKQKTNYDDGR